MEFDREELLGALVDLSPALDKPGAIIELSHLWFTESHVHAYDGGVGVRVKLATALEGGVAGKTLIEMLRTSALKQVEIKMLSSKTDVQIKMGKSTVVLALLPFDEKRNEWPYPSKVSKSTVTIELTADVLAALTTTMLVANNDKTRVINNGVFIYPSKDALDFVGTDAASIIGTTVKQKPPAGFKKKVILPWKFVKLILGIAKPGALLHIYNTEDTQCLVVASDTYEIGSNMLDLEDTQDVLAVLNMAVDACEDDSVPLPAGLQAFLDRAAILAPSDAENAVVTLDVSAKTLGAIAEYSGGSTEEEFPLDKKVSTAEGSFRIDLLRRGLAKTEAFAFGPAALVMHGDGVTYAVAKKSKPQAKAKPQPKAAAGKTKRNPTKVDPDEEIPF